AEDDRPVRPARRRRPAEPDRPWPQCRGEVGRTVYGQGGGYLAGTARRSRVGAGGRATRAVPPDSGGRRGRGGRARFPTGTPFVYSVSRRIRGIARIDRVVM